MSNDTQLIKDLTLIRNYFGENDKTPFQHMSYSVLDNLIKNMKEHPLTAEDGRINPPSPVEFCMNEH